MIVSFDRFEKSLAVFRGTFDRHSLDYATLGHISDGNVHPNVIPHRVEDVERGQTAILECGREIISMGGCPLAEHGVGRNVVKQTLLRESCMVSKASNRYGQSSGLLTQRGA